MLQRSSGTLRHSPTSHPPKTSSEIFTTIKIGVHQCTSIITNHRPLSKLHPGEGSHPLHSVLNRWSHHPNLHRTTWLREHPVLVQAFHPSSPYLRKDSVRQLQWLLEHGVVPMKYDQFDTTCSWTVCIDGRWRSDRSCPETASTFGVSHHSTTLLQLPWIIPHLSNQNCRLAEDKIELPQALASTFPWNHFPSHIPGTFYASPAIGPISLQKVSLQTSPTLNHQVLKNSTQSPSSMRHSLALVATSTSNHFSSNCFHKQLRQQKLGAHY